MDKLVVAISLTGILIGIGLFLYQLVSGFWMCVGNTRILCSGPPLSYYLPYYTAIAMIIVSLVALVWGLKRDTIGMRPQTREINRIEHT